MGPTMQMTPGGEPRLQALHPEDDLETRSLQLAMGGYSSSGQPGPVRSWLSLWGLGRCARLLALILSHGPVLELFGI